MPNAEFNITKNGATCDSALNTWRWNKGHSQRLAKGENVQIPSTVEDPNAKRLDYIFFSSGSRRDTATGQQTSDWTLKEANVGMTARHPTLFCSLSDHFSVEATLVRNLNSSPTTTEHTLDIPETYLPINYYDEILTMITKYEARERTQRRLRMGHFGFQLCLTIGCLVGVWWSPRNYVSFILMLISSLSLSVGVIEGLLGGLFVSSELRALKEFEWGVRSTRERAAEAGQKNEVLELS